MVLSWQFSVGFVIAALIHPTTGLNLRPPPPFSNPVDFSAEALPLIFSQPFLENRERAQLQQLRKGLGKVDRRGEEGKTFCAKGRRAALQRRTRGRETLTWEFCCQQ